MPDEIDRAQEQEAQSPAEARELGRCGQDNADTAARAAESPAESPAEA